MQDQKIEEKENKCEIRYVPILAACKSFAEITKHLVKINKIF